MKTRVTLASVMVIVGLTTAAHADIISGGPAYGGPASIGGAMTCRLFNAGLSSATVSFRQIYDNTGAAVALSGDSCNVTLAPTKSCAFAAAIGGNLAFSCRAGISGNDENVSGVVEIQNSGGGVLTVVPMR